MIAEGWSSDLVALIDVASYLWFNLSRGHVCLCVWDDGEEGKSSSVCQHQDVRSPEQGARRQSETSKSVLLFKLGHQLV